MKNRLPFLISIIVIVSGGLMCLFTEWSAYNANGNYGFPLDDPWIHLQFAKNLHDYGSYSYYKNEMVTAGSTSPLYTLMLSIGFIFTSNEMILSYMLGVGFFLIAAFFLIKFVLKDFEDNLLYACAAAYLLLFEPHLQWVALSGMETTLFIFLLIVTLYVYKLRRNILLGICLSLLLWTRPEALLFIAVLIIDAIYHSYLLRQNNTEQQSGSSAGIAYRWLWKSIFIFALFGIVYVGFNLWLSGSVFPNTFAAKIKYYSHGGRNFLEQVLHFLVDGHFVFFAVFVGVGIISIIYQFVKRQPQKFLIPFLWSLGLFLAYWKNLPFLYQEGRYLMPILPFYILIGLHGLDIAITLSRKLLPALAKHHVATATGGIALLIVTVQFTLAAWNGRKNYTEYCRYITERQVNGAKWLNNNLPVNAVIATHDIGAVAFYSNRKVVDMVGLVSPEMIERIGSLDRMEEFLARKKVTHLVVLRNWFEVVNQNPIYQTDERHPEILEVFKFDPSQTHFTPRNVSSLTDAARYYLSIGNLQQAGPLLEQAVLFDPKSSRAHFLLGAAYFAQGNLEKAESELNIALQLHPTYWDVYSMKVNVALKRNQPKEAISYLEKIVENNPSYAEGYRALAQIYQSFHIDSVKAIQHFQHYKQLTQGSAQ